MLTFQHFPYFNKKRFIMPVKKITSEVKSTIGNIKAKFGTVDKKNPQAVYIEYGTFVQPTFETKSYKDPMEICEAEIKKMLVKYFKENCEFSDNFIFIFDAPSERMSIKKKTYLSIQIHLKVNKGSNYSTMDFKTMAINYLTDEYYIFNETEKILAENGFSCSKEKK